MKLVRLLGPLVLVLACFFAATSKAPEAEKVSYDREVQKILAEACFKCHGPDPGTRVSDLRLDQPESAYSKLKGGYRAIVPGKPNESEALKRIKLAADHDDHMPPTYTNKKLTSEQIAKIELWIQQGAKYEKHWSFVPPVRPAVPSAPAGTNPIDAFIEDKLRREGLKPNPRADFTTLTRRIALDLTGIPLPPQTVPKDEKGLHAIIEKQLASPHYGERMALPWLDVARYADTHGYHIDSERSMWPWRDWVIDAFNKNMPYDRFITEQIAGDLLPNATASQKLATGFNRNHPITYEGGAIPEEYMVAYSADRVDTTSTAMLGLTMRCASCHDHKYEPITQEDYYRFFAFFNNIDEIGLDGQQGNAKPFMRAGSSVEEAKLTALKTKASTYEKLVTAKVEANLARASKLNAESEELTPSDHGLVARYQLRNALNPVIGTAPVPVVPASASAIDGVTGPTYEVNGMDRIDLGQVADFEADQAFSYGAWFKPVDGNGGAMAKMDSANDYRGWDLFMDTGRPMIHIISTWPSNCLKVISQQTIKLGEWSHVFVTYDGSKKPSGIKLYINGQPVSHTTEKDSLTGTIKTDKPVTLGGRTGNNGWKGGIDAPMIYRRVLSGADVQKIALSGVAKPILSIPEGQRTDAQKRELSRMWSSVFDSEYPVLVAQYDAAVKAVREFERKIPTSMVMGELEKPRKTFFLERGAYDKPTHEVLPAIPSMFLSTPLGLAAPRSGEAHRTPLGRAEGGRGEEAHSTSKGNAAPRPNAPPQRGEGPSSRLTRLDLAKWLTASENPLVARVAVNRLWQHFFGVGLVKSSENLGVQGEYPSHPELLDWLATEFIRTKWDVKRMVRLIVSSRAYQRSNVATPAMLKKDPENRLLARASRLRLPAEVLRDQALSVSGLLVLTIGGPSVRPYQPKGLWEEMSIDPDAGNSNFSAQSYVQDHGDKLYRRGMYTFWKRTVPPPMMQVLDAPEREFCIVRRPPTNTPLQALVTMNETSYVEAARNLGQRLLKEAGDSDAARIDTAMRLLHYRSASKEELQVLIKLVRNRRVHYTNASAEAAKLVKVGESAYDAKLDASELATWTVVCNAILNMDESLVRP